MLSKKLSDGNVRIGVTVTDAEKAMVNIQKTSDADGRACTAAELKRRVRHAAQNLVATAAERLKDARGERLPSMARARSLGWKKNWIAAQVAGKVLNKPTPRHMTQPTGAALFAGHASDENRHSGAKGWRKMDEGWKSPSEAERAMAAKLGLTAADAWRTARLSSRT